jgi:hypothetical protein
MTRTEERLAESLLEEHPGWTFDEALETARQMLAEEAIAYEESKRFDRRFLQERAPTPRPNLSVTRRRWHLTSGNRGV